MTGTQTLNFGPSTERRRVNGGPELACPVTGDPTAGAVCLALACPHAVDGECCVTCDREERETP